MNLVAWQTFNRYVLMGIGWGGKMQARRVGDSHTEHVVVQSGTKQRPLLTRNRQPACAQLLQLYTQLCHQSENLMYGSY